MKKKIITEANYDIAALAQKRVLNVRELSAYSGLSRSAIWKLTRKGIIPHSKPNSKTIWFDRLKIEAFLLSNPQPTAFDIEKAATDYVINNPLQGGSK